MSYPLSLDEIPEGKLLREIRRRHNARRKGVCDYCGRYKNEMVCKFPDRHALANKRDKVCSD